MQLKDQMGAGCGLIVKKITARDVEVIVYYEGGSAKADRAKKEALATMAAEAEAKKEEEAAKAEAEAAAEDRAKKEALATMAAEAEAKKEETALKKEAEATKADRAKREVFSALAAGAGIAGAVVAETSPAPQLAEVEAEGHAEAEGQAEGQREGANSEWTAAWPMPDVGRRCSPSTVESAGDLREEETAERREVPHPHPTLRGPHIDHADASSLLHADHSPLCNYPMLIDTGLERAEAELSNAVSTSAWKLVGGVWLAFKSELESTGLSTGPLE